MESMQYCEMIQPPNVPHGSDYAWFNLARGDSININLFFVSPRRRPVCNFLNNAMAELIKTERWRTVFAPRVDVTETFAPVAKMETIIIILALSAQLQLQVFQLDVKSAFINGKL